jgi:L-asparaginase
MRRVILFALGGTIASLPAEDPTNGVVPSIDARELVRSVPGLEAIARVESRTMRQMASANFSFADLIEISDAIRDAFSRGVDGVVVTQGTDNIEETAFAFDLLVDDERPVVVTAAMRNPSLSGADGPANVRAAVAVAVSPFARGMGCLVVMNDEIHAARFVRKMHASSLSAFASPQCGPIGVVIEDRVHFYTRVGPLAKARPSGAVAPVALDSMRIWATTGASCRRSTGTWDTAASSSKDSAAVTFRSDGRAARGACAHDAGGARLAHWRGRCARVHLRLRGLGD